MADRQGLDSKEHFNPLKRLSQFVLEQRLAIYFKTFPKNPAQGPRRVMPYPLSAKRVESKWVFKLESRDGPLMFL